MKKRKSLIPQMIQDGPNEAAHRMVEFADFYHRVKTNLFPVKRYAKGRNNVYLFRSGWEGFHPVGELLRACDELGYETTYHVLEVIKIRGYNLTGGPDHFNGEDFKALRRELVGSAVLSGFEDPSWREVLTSAQIMESRQRELKAAEARKAKAEAERALQAEKEEAVRRAPFGVRVEQAAYEAQERVAGLVETDLKEALVETFRGLGFEVAEEPGMLVVTLRG